MLLTEQKKSEVFGNLIGGYYLASAILDMTSKVSIVKVSTHPKYFAIDVELDQDLSEKLFPFLEERVKGFFKKREPIHCHEMVQASAIGFLKSKKQHLRARALKDVHAPTHLIIQTGFFADFLEIHPSDWASFKAAANDEKALKGSAVKIVSSKKISTVKKKDRITPVYRLTGVVQGSMAEKEPLKLTSLIDEVNHSLLSGEGGYYAYENQLFLLENGVRVFESIKAQIENRLKQEGAEQILRFSSSYSLAEDVKRLSLKNGMFFERVKCYAKRIPEAFAVSPHKNYAEATRYNGIVTCDSSSKDEKLKEILLCLKGVFESLGLRVELFSSKSHARVDVKAPLKGSQSELLYVFDSDKDHAWELAEVACRVEEDEAYIEFSLLNIELWVALSIEAEKLKI